MKPFNVIIGKSNPPTLLTKDEILKDDGIYGSINNPDIRFVTCRGSTFIFGDSCPLYKSGDCDKGSGCKEYFKVDESIIFQKVPKL